MNNIIFQFKLLKPFYVSKNSRTIKYSIIPVISLAK